MNYSGSCPAFWHQRESTPLSCIRYLPSVWGNITGLSCDASRSVWNHSGLSWKCPRVCLAEFLLCYTCTWTLLACYISWENPQCSWRWEHLIFITFCLSGAYWYELDPSKRSAGNQKGKLHNFCLQCVRIKCFCASLALSPCYSFLFTSVSLTMLFFFLPFIRLMEKPFSELNSKFNRLNISAIFICVYM